MQYSLTYNPSSLSSKSTTVSENAILLEWKEIQAAQQNPSLFRPLYDRYYEPIFRFIHRRTADEFLAADICSDVFYKAMQKLNRYNYKGVPFSAWLYRIASNEITQHFRKSQKNRIVSIETAVLPDMMEEMGDLRAVGNYQFQVALIPSLNQLKEKDLAIIELRYFEHRPFKEIAEMLEISESTCKMRTYRVLERLKKIILNNRNFSE